MKNGKYRVNIGFKRKRYYIGVFEYYDKAVESRLNAEHVIHDRFLQAYYDWKKKADADPGWGEKNPLQFEIDWQEIFPSKKKK